MSIVEMVVLNVAKGDFTSDFDTKEEKARNELREFITDMLTKGYALFLEEGEDTHRIQAYDPGTNEFTVAGQRKGKRSVKISATSPEETTKAPARKRGTAVAPSAGG